MEGDAGHWITGDHAKGTQVLTERADWAMLIAAPKVIPFRVTIITTDRNSHNGVEMDVAASPFKGSLRLDWTNRDDRLLTKPDGQYTWVHESDYRVAEVRLLHDLRVHGEISGERSSDNLLIIGDALNGLHSMANLPEFAAQLLGKVRLAYLDPPFNTQQAFAQYDDGLEHSVWLTMMRDRLVQIARLLSQDGSIWVHCDDAEQAYLKVLMDEVFGRENFIACIIWEKTDSPRMDAQNFSVRHDYILVYAKSEQFLVNPLKATDEGAQYTRIDEQGRRYYLNPLRARGQSARREDRPSLYFPIIAPDGSEIWPKLPSGADGRWRWSSERVERDAHLLEFIQGQAGWTANYRIYENEHRTRPPETIWTHAEVGSNRTSKQEIKQLFPVITPFETPKPEELIARIIQLGTNPGDIVLDCFLGSGTTAAVAHKLGRRWVGIERELSTVEDYIEPRLRKVISGADQGGVSKAASWSGGGGFRVLAVAPSMYDLVGERVVLSDWATNGKLSEAVAAQFGYEYRPNPPFAGSKGKARLVVVDGLVNDGVIDLLLPLIEEDETLHICGTALDKSAIVGLRARRAGSRAERIPDATLANYRTLSDRKPRWERSRG